MHASAYSLHTLFATALHSAHVDAASPESSPPVRGCKYITGNRARLTRLKITTELGGGKTTAS